MAALGALTQAWTAAEAALPLGLQVSGLYRFGDLWIGLAEVLGLRCWPTAWDRRCCSVMIG